MGHPERGQSETVGNVLLVGVVVVVATTISIGVAFNFTGGAGDLGEETKRVDIQASATTENLTLSHNGGSRVNGSDLLVIVSDGSAETRFSIDPANTTGDDGSFDPGETLTRRHGLTGTEIDVRVYYRGGGEGRTFLRTALPVSTDPVAFGSTVWESASDWNSAESERAVVHDGFGDHSGAGAVELGDSRNRSGLVGYWPFDESAGASTATDVSPNSNQGSLSGPTAGVAGIARTSAYEFAAGDSVVVPGSASLDDVQANGSFTLSTWVKTTDSGTAPLWSQFDGYGPGNASDDLVVGLRDGRVSALVGSDGALSANETVASTGEWTSGTFENTTVEAGELRLERTREVAYGSLAVPDSSGTVEAEVGFEPDLVVFRTYVVGAPFGQTASVGGQALGSGTGFADCTRDPCTEVAQSFGSGSASPNAQTSAATTQYSIQQVVTDADGDAFLGRVNGTVSGTDGSGFTVSFEDVVASGPTVQVGYRAYTFPGSSEVDVGTFRTPSAGTTGEQTYTTGFRPTSVRTVTGPSLNTADDIEQSAPDEFGWSHGWAIDNESRDTGPEQVSISVSADSRNIDDHVYAARDDAVLNTLWTDKGGIDGRVRAGLTGFDASGFTLDYTLNNPESVDGDRFAALYLAVNTSTEPELGFGRTPTATGRQTYGTSAPVSALSLFGVNTIPDMDVEGYSGTNEADNHLGWMTGGGKLTEDGRALGFSGHSNSVNGHAVATTDTAPVDLLYTDQDGNVLGRDAAEFVGTSGEQFTLDWTAVTTTATADVASDRSLFVWHSYGGPEEYVQKGEYRQTLDVGREVYWNRTVLTESLPAGTNTDVTFSDGSQWYDSLDTVPRTDAITLNITLRSGGSDTPTVSAARAEYRNVTLANSLETDTDAEWRDGTFDNTTVEDGALTLTGTQVGEAGTVTTSDGNWQTVTFGQSYTNPVVVGTTNTHNGESALTFDARNVGPTSAEVRVCESEGGSNDGCDAHGPETVGYVVVDAAETDSVAGIEAGQRTLSGGIDAAETVPYAERFGTTPVVLGNVQTTDGAQPVETRVTDTSASGFSVGICHQGSKDACDDGHGDETVGWVALEPGNLPFAGSTRVGTTGASVGDSEWTDVSFVGFDQTPVVVVSTLTENGPEELQIDEARSVDASGAEVRYCELETGDGCDTHTNENVGWFAVEPGPLKAGSADSGTYTRTLDAGRVVDWTGASAVTTEPSGTGAEIRYEVGGTRYADITNVPDAATLTLNVSLSQTSGARPTVDSAAVGYEATGWRTGTTRVDDGQWHSVTTTYDGSDLVFYVDGQRDATRSVDADLSPGTVTAEIGGESDYGWTFDGTLDAVRLFSQARAAAAVNASAGADSEGVLVTGQRVFDNEVQPGTLTLTDVTATEPSGTNVTLVVESDPDVDGDYEEASDPIELDGSDSYDVTGVDIESEVFRLRVILETDTPTTGPLFEEATLKVNS